MDSAVVINEVDQSGVGTCTFDTFLLCGQMDAGTINNVAQLDQIVVDREMNRGDIEAIFDLFYRQYGL